MNHRVKWVDRYRYPKGQPNPDYPNGIDIDSAKGARKACLVDLPYPAARCGYYMVTCDSCGYHAVITTAGRADDPKSVRLPCRPEKK
jgi:hypothetical protein